jgi:acyl-coenzyme A thioesterase PaaI-like protein
MANKSNENMQLLMEWVHQLQRDAPSSLADKATGFYDHHIVKDVVIESSEPGRVVFSLCVKPRHVNSDGLLHEGVMASLVDVLGTAALITVGQRVGMSVEINVSFMSSAVAEVKISLHQLFFVDSRLKSDYPQHVLLILQHLLQAILLSFLCN